MEEQSSDFQERITKVKKAIQKATSEAQASPTFFTAAENHDPNASFHLGVELFGQDPSVVEEKIQDGLVALEEEVRNIILESSASKEGDGSTLAASRESLEEESRQLQMKIRFLKECSVARAKLDESATASSPVLSAGTEPDYAESVERLVEASQALGRAEAMVDTERQHYPTSAALGPAYKILDASRSAIRKQRADLISWARKEWTTSVTLSEESLSVRTGPALMKAFTVLEVLAQKQENPALHDVLNKFTRTLHQNVFAPLLKSHREGKPFTGWHFEEVEERVTTSSTTIVTTSAAKGSVRRLEWTRPDASDNDSELNNPTAKSGSNPPNLGVWKDTFDFVERILDFVTDRILLNRETLCAYVGKRFFGKPGALPEELNLEAIGIESCRMGDDHGVLLEPLVEALNETSIPLYLKADETDSLFSMGSEIASILDPFLEHVASKNLLPEDGETRLSTFASSFEHKYIENRRCLILNEARQLLVQNDYHNTVQVGVDVGKSKDEELLGVDNGLAVFMLHKSSVSDTAFKLMTLCRKTMDEVVEQQAVSGDSPFALLAPTLYRSAREVLDMFRAIIPVTHGHEIANVPRTAAVLHNDCVFLAHHCGTLGLEYKEKFPPAQPDDSRGGLLRQTCMFVDMVPLFRDLADRAMGDMLDLQARQLVELVGERIASLGVALRSDKIVPAWAEAETALEASLYHLRHLAQAWKPVLSYDILNRSLCFLADVVFSLFLDQLGTDVTDISANACQFMGTLFQKATHDVGDLVEGDKSTSRVWSRFSAIGQFLDMSLAEIQVALSDGVFRDVTGPELSRLITACFDDSPKRRNVLNLLMTN